ncbi:hypothetical protein B1R32_10483 [Abditibacterium utsteinense]|uniref:Uncharacterized protein n=1 Tax=Abditibacterium utsteinense TaxID=1960156 RepID=A0A2S8SUX1_9BACT|nr:hypothetical protein B1R32_10483 [Abditibacterium utsteinense]
MIFVNNKSGLVGTMLALSLDGLNLFLHRDGFYTETAFTQRRLLHRDGFYTETAFAQRRLLHRDGG